MKTYQIVLAGLVLAATPGIAAAKPAQAETQLVASPAADFARFAPRPGAKATKLDFTFWDEQLRYMVLAMGASTRAGASKPAPQLGTRFIYGHDSRYRMEGNRVVFELLEDDVKQALRDYRLDLERLGGEIDIAALPRNEQLAYWINLHNAAMIDMVAHNYPVASPDKIDLDGSGRPLDETPFITVAGVRMSPKDIRTRIVFPGWQDPRVIYGFFRATIGGPSILRVAYTGESVGQQLANSAKEFVNSLRGVEGYNDILAVSEIYAEAAPFFFPDPNRDLRAHLTGFADPEVARLIAEKPVLKMVTYPQDIADLANGEREPSYAYNDQQQALGVNLSPSMLRMLKERDDKYAELRREGKVGIVIVLDPDQPEENAGEVE